MLLHRVLSVLGFVLRRAGGFGVAAMLSVMTASFFSVAGVFFFRMALGEAGAMALHFLMQTADLRLQAFDFSFIGYGFGFHAFELRFAARRCAPTRNQAIDQTGHR